MNKYAQSAIAVLLLKIAGPAWGEPDALCGYLSNPPDFPAPTMMHIFVWDLTDLIITSNALTQTVVVPPFGVNVVPNPREDTYNGWDHDGEFDHGVVPTPIPPGIWIIEGNNSLTGLLCTLPTCVVIAHPGNNFKCVSVDQVPS